MRDCRLHVFDFALRFVGCLLYVSVMFAVDVRTTLSSEGQLVDTDSDEVDVSHDGAWLNTAKMNTTAKIDLYASVPLREHQNGAHTQ